MIKFLALDIDGTILKKDYTFSAKVKEAINKAIDKGVKVALVTGRMHCAAQMIADKLDIDVPIFSYQGALVKENGKTILQTSMNDELTREVLHDLRQFDAQVNLYMNDELYSERETERLIEYCEKRDLSYKIQSFDEIKEISAHKLLAIGATPEETDKAIEYLKEKYSKDLYVVKSMPMFCEITDIKVSKGKTIEHLCKQHWGIDLDDTMAIGDQDNDIEMLKVVKVKVAMGNATQGLMDVAKVVVPSVDEDGVAFAIEKFILKEEV